MLVVTFMSPPCTATVLDETVDAEIPLETSYRTLAIGAGDVNGDGFGELLTYDYAPESVRLYPGSEMGVAPAEFIEIAGPNGYWSVVCGAAPAGDLDGDGFHDLVIAECPGENGTWSRQYTVVWGDVSGVRPEAWTGLGATPNYTIYASASAAGDTDGDGVDDLTYADWGDAFVCTGGTSGLDCGLLEAGGGEFSGAAVAGVGDTNGDGYSDVAVERWDWYSADPSEGFVHLGGAAGVATSADIHWVATADAGLTSGDTDDDGYADVWFSDAIYLGGPSGPGAEAVQRVSEPCGPEAYYNGILLGNLNGDRYPDFGFNNGRVCFGGAGGPEPHGGLNFAADAYAEPAGDVNGDGLDDIALIDGVTVEVVHGFAIDTDADGIYGSEDCDDTDASVGVATETEWLDGDGDGHAVSTLSRVVCDWANNWSASVDDCDDTDGAVYPGAPEVECDGIDNDCDGVGAGPADWDGDGLEFDAEADIGTDPCDADTDGDGLSDGDDPTPLDGGEDTADPEPPDPPDRADTGDGSGNGDELPPGGHEQPRCGCDTAPAPGWALLFALAALRRRTTR